MFGPVLDLSTLTSETGLIIDGADAHDIFGGAVAGAGDFNDDGYDDVIVGAVGYGTLQGAAYVIFGSASGPADGRISAADIDGSNGFSVIGPSSWDRAGIGLNGIGDFNGDGIDDVAVGAFFADGEANSWAGETFVIHGVTGGYGAERILTNPLSYYRGVTYLGDQKLDKSGNSVSGIGDFNGDGYDDMVIGAENADRSGTKSGAAYVVYGNSGGSSVKRLSDIDGTNGFQVTGKAAEDFLGGSVSGAGDLNGDGYDDVVINALGVDGGGERGGEAYVLFGGPDVRPATFGPDTLNGTNGFVLRGAAAGAILGSDISDAGDVNDDGYDDLIVGAVGEGPNGTLSGKAYVIYGRANFDAVLDPGAITASTGFAMHGALAEDLAGWSVSGAGDLNNDGFDDVAVGAIGVDLNGDLSGATYLVFGAAARDDAPVELGALDGEDGFVILGAAAGDLTGFSISQAGDVNGDGRDDLIIGAPETSEFFENAGRAYVVYGQGDPVPVAAADDAFALTEDVIQYGNVLDDHGSGADEGPGALSIYAVEGLPGNVGRTIELASGATVRINEDGSFNYNAKAALNHLRAGETATETVSYSLWSGDGVSTVTRQVSLSDISEGDGSSGFALIGAAAGDMTGRAVSGAGDVNGDGIADIIVGAQGVDGNGDRSGASYVVFGTDGDAGAGTLALSALDGKNGVMLVGAAANDRSGDAVSGAGDVNGDGIDDLIIGSWGADGGGDLSGGAHVVYGVAGGFGAASLDMGALSPAQGFALIGASSVDYSGRSVSGAGDVNGDGIDDLIVGAHRAGVAGEGESYVVFGTRDARGDVDLGALDGTDGFVLVGAGAGEDSGALVAGAGDLNGDGIDDLIIGAYDAPLGKSKANGATYVVYGAEDGSHGAQVDLGALDGENGFVVRGRQSGALAGRGASAVGDVNGDGRADLIIGAPGAESPNTNGGVAHLLFGGFDGAELKLSDLYTPDAITIKGAATGAAAGRSVSGAGDVNGDGFDDLLIGAHGAAGDAARAGKAYVVFGAADLAASDWIDLEDLDGTDGFAIIGAAAGAAAGFQVSAAGDVNNDGFADLLVGAPGGDGAGAAWVVYGRNTFTPVADTATVTFTVTGIDDAPIAYDDHFTIAPGEKLSGSVLVDNGGGADIDPEGTALTVIEIDRAALAPDGPVILASGASVTLRADGTFDYDPLDAFDTLVPGQEAEDAFAYAISDGDLSSNGFVTITIDGGNLAPRILSPDAFEIDEGAAAVAALRAEDGDGEALSWSITGGADAALFTLGADGALSFIAAPDFDAPGDAGGDNVYDVTVQATDGLDAAAQDIAVTVEDVLPPLIGEVMQLTVGTSWQTLTFANQYDDPVVFALSPTLNEFEAAATRFKNITDTGAEILLQEPRRVMGEPSPNVHADESVTLLVLEKGVHTLQDGTVIQVGALTTNKLYVSGFEDVDFAAGFDATPAIFSQVQTIEGTDWIVSRQRRADEDGFQLTMQEEQADNVYHAAETVGWFAIEGGSGTLSGIDWQAGSSAKNVNGKLTDVAFNEAFDTAPLVVATLATYAGTDPGSSRIGEVSDAGFTAMVLEDRSLDLETQHGYEQVDWMAFSGAGTLRDGPAAPEKILETGLVTATDAVISVSFGSHFDNPVVIASLNTENGSVAALARISGVTGNGFDLRVQAPDDHEGPLAAEQVAWMVVEAGSWALEDGTIIEAGRTEIGAVARYGFDTVAYAQKSGIDAAVLTQTQTENDAAFVKTRMDGVVEGGFRVALEEEEDASWGGHGAETVGWVAIAQGGSVAAGTARANHKAQAVEFNDAFDFAPAVLGGMASFNANDAADTAISGVSETGFAIAVEEDVTLNDETGHGHEDFHWAAFEPDQEIWGTFVL